jgi:RNA polymerase sigma factor (sigma-70 family)
VYSFVLTCVMCFSDAIDFFYYIVIECILLNKNRKRLRVYFFSVPFSCLFKKSILFSDKNQSDESQLWDGIKAGDNRALEKVYNLHVKALYNYGNKICQNSSIVEDAIHDLFVDLVSYRKNLSPVISIKAYLFTSLRRKIIKAAKNSNAFGYDDKWEEFHLLVDSEEDRLIEMESLDEQTEKLRSNLNNLSPRQYEAIVLRFYDKLSYDDIATVMEVNEQSVRNLIQRGLENLRQYSRLTISIMLIIHCFIPF